jgi:hypothetical protein
MRLDGNRVQKVCGKEINSGSIGILQEGRFPVKHSLIGLAVCVVVLSFALSSIAQEVNTPYPPPTSGNVVKNLATRSTRDFGPTGTEMGADLALVRPLSFAANIMGIGLAVVATPFGLATGTTCQIYDKLVREPWDFATHRPLGEF